MPKIESKDLIRREILSQIISHLPKPEITLLVGARQVGKTVLLGMVRDYLVKEKRVEAKNVLAFNLDIERDWEFFQDQTRIIEYLEEKSSKDKIYFLVDEAQRISDCARFFKGIYDSNLNVKLILSGSASLELKTRLKESLAGRKQIFHLFPFSFFEFLKTKDKNLAEILEKGKEISFLSRKRLISLFKEYNTWGGYPRVVLSETQEEKQNILAEIYTSYIERDIIGFLEIKNRLGFSRLVKLLAGQTGQLVNISELTNSLNLDRDTVERYIKALEETFIITSLFPFFKNPRQEIIKQNKIYFNDSGLRNYALEDFSSFEERRDAGFLLENAILKEILLSLGPFGKIRFWRTKQGSEIDFLVLRGENVLPIEIKLNLKKPQIPLGLRNFLEKYSPKLALVVNMNICQKSIQFKKTKIDFIHPYEIRKYLKTVKTNKLKS